MFCLPVETSCPPTAENINNTSEHKYSLFVRKKRTSYRISENPQSGFSENQQLYLQTLIARASSLTPILLKHLFFLGFANGKIHSRLFIYFDSFLVGRLSRYRQFKDFSKRMLVATNLFGRGMDIERVNIVFNYDMPEDSDTYLHRVCTQFYPSC